MKIHGLCIVKDESDIIEECLVRALAWCDSIYVLDNGSTDGTWYIVKKIARQHPEIIPYKQYSGVFSDSLRCEIFNAFRHQAEPGDWWCRLDADEFYIDDPRIFLAKVPPRYGLVITASITYYFTDLDAERYIQDRESYLKLPLEERVRYYLAHWSEPRFFRHFDGMVWTPDHGGFPAAVSKMEIYPVRIWLKHFQYRSPEQIERRLRARWPAIQMGTFGHEAVQNWSQAVASIRQGCVGLNDARPQYASNRWQDRVVSASSLDFDALDNRYVIDERLFPQVDMRRSLKNRLHGIMPKSLRRIIRQVVGFSLKVAH